LKRGLDLAERMPPGANAGEEIRPPGPRRNDRGEAGPDAPDAEDLERSPLGSQGRGGPQVGLGIETIVDIPLRQVDDDLLR